MLIDKLEQLEQLQSRLFCLEESIHKDLKDLIQEDDPYDVKTALSRLEVFRELKTQHLEVQGDHVGEPLDLVQECAFSDPRQTYDLTTFYAHRRVHTEDRDIVDTAHYIIREGMATFRYQKPDDGWY